MESSNIKVLIVAAVFLNGCLTAAQGLNPPYKSIYEKGYREGVRENIDKYISEQDGSYRVWWQEPVVQEVEVPAHISQGVFIPQHKEMVIIKPGEWKTDYSYPIERKSRRDENDKESFKYYDSGVTDITVKPQRFKSSSESVSE